MRGMLIPTPEFGRRRGWGLYILFITLMGAAIYPVVAKEIGAAGTLISAGTTRTTRPRLPHSRRYSMSGLALCRYSPSIHPHPA